MRNVHSKLVHSLILDEAKKRANERIAKLQLKTEVEVKELNEEIVMENDYDFSNTETEESLLIQAFSIIHAFEYNKVRVDYEQQLLKINTVVKKLNRKGETYEIRLKQPPKVFKRYRYSLLEATPQKLRYEQLHDIEMLALILSKDAEEHYIVCGTYPRTTENKFIREMRKRPKFGTKLTLSDEYHFEQLERTARENLYSVEKLQRDAELQQRSR